MSYFRSINQAVIVSLENTDTSNLAVNQTFTGSGISTLGVNAIQVNLKADQNCTVYVEQGPDSTNWYISDDYKYHTNKGGDGWTTQATDAYTRVRVTNTGTAPTTQKVLSTVLCPIVETLPRALSEEGNLKVGVYEIEGDFGTRVTVSAMNSLKTTRSTRLIGASFIGDTTDTNFWTFSGTGTGTSSQTGGELTLATGATASSTVRVNSNRRARYIGASPNYYRANLTCPTQAGACTRRWGAFDTSDGYFFQYDGTSLSAMSRKGGVDTTQATNGSFNGVWGQAYILDNSCNTYEIHWSNKNTYYIVNNDLLHTLTSAATTSVGNPSLTLGLECNNGTGNTSNNRLLVRSSTINRLGDLITQPTSFFRNTTTAGLVLKYGAGNLHSLIIGSVAASGGTVTIYDGTSTAGSILTAFTFTWPAGGNYNPTSFDFKGLPFYNGLFYVNGTQNASATIVYE